MYNSNIPSDRELPSTVRLVKSTVIAAVTAGILLVCVVIPAEYGIDPTGVGKMTGLKRMGEIKVSLAEEAANDAANAAKAAAEQPADTELMQVVEKNAEDTVSGEAAAPVEDSSAQSHEMSVTLAPDQGTEIKVTMVKGAKVSYEWETSGGKANFDVHGDSKKLQINYHNYYKGADQRREGDLVAAFDGKHGWFWRNRTKETLKITLKTNGEYTDIQRF